MSTTLTGTTVTTTTLTATTATIATLSVTALTALATVLKLNRSTVSLTGDAQSVDADDKSYIALSSDSAVAADRDFALSQGASGQILVLEWVGTNAGQVVDGSANSDAGNIRLSADWTPTQYDILVLISNGTDWIEVARSTN